VIERLRIWAQATKRDVVALYLASRDPRVPWRAKALAAGVAAYALSPIDLIPDFIPVLGQIDDLIIVPLGILLAVKMIPPAIMEELRARAARMSAPETFSGALAVVATWTALTVVVSYLAYREFSSP
jgi:uncharacterized membrane protein YkvA (DUF1232 family)